MLAFAHMHLQVHLAGALDRATSNCLRASLPPVALPLDSPFAQAIFPCKRRAISMVHPCHNASLLRARVTPLLLKGIAQIIDMILVNNTVSRNGDKQSFPWLPDPPIKTVSENDSPNVVCLPLHWHIQPIRLPDAGSGQDHDPSNETVVANAHADSFCL